ncbi:MAG: hypothetical protein UH788_07710 [Treponemataceae bacterium]|nr:hypothetical protein [Treponemataceae bacterium]
MKNRLHDKKAGIAILVSLIIISVAEVIYRAIIANGIVFTTSNFGEQLTVIIFALMILILTAKGKDRVCYILYGAWIAYFVMDQAFELPGMVGELIMNFSATGIAISTILLRLLSMLCIIVLSALLVEYMNDGSIYNRAFNILTVITILLHVVTIVLSICGIIFDVVPNGIDLALLQQQVMLVIFNNLYRIAMVFLFTFFAYDSAKKQLSKVDFSK